MSSLLRRLGLVGADHRRIASAALRVAVFLFFGKLLGAAKEMVVAWRYGVSDVVDAYQFTMVLANWLPVLLVGAASVVLIPALVKSRSQAQHASFLGELQAWCLVSGAALALGLYAFWPVVLRFLGADLPARVQQMSAQLILGFAPVAFFTLWIGFSAARLRARERHINTLTDGIVALAIMVWVLVLPPDYGVWPLLWGTFTGFALQAVVLQILARRADGPARPLRAACAAPQWQALWAAAGIMLMGQFAMSMVGPLDQYTAAGLGANANAVLGYASRILALLIGLGAVSVGRAALPVLAEVHARGARDHARKVALKWSLLMFGAACVVLLLGWALAPWAVAVLYERGAFGAQDTLAVAAVLRWGLLQLPFYFAVLVLVQLLASQGRYRAMAAVAVLNFVVKIALNCLLAPVFGVAGIMLATVAMYGVSFCAYLVLALRPLAGAEHG